MRSALRFLGDLFSTRLSPILWLLGGQTACRIHRMFYQGRNSPMPQGQSLDRTSLTRHLTEQIWRLTYNAYVMYAVVNSVLLCCGERWSRVPRILDFTCTCKINKSSRYAARHTSYIDVVCFQEQFSDDVSFFVDYPLCGGAVSAHLPEHQTFAIEGCCSGRDLTAWRQRRAAKTNKAALSDMAFETEFEEPRRDRRHKHARGNGSGRKSCSNLYHAAAVSILNPDSKPEATCPNSTAASLVDSCVFQFGRIRRLRPSSWCSMESS